MGNSNKHISSQLGRNPSDLWHEPLPQAVVQSSATTEEKVPAAVVATPTVTQAVVLPQTQRSLMSDARFFSDSAPSAEVFPFHTELATELKEIYRTIAVKGEKAEHAANAPAAEAMDHRHHVLRLWAEYQKSHRVLKEGLSEGVDGYSLRSAMDLVADLAEKMPNLSSEESLELGVYLSQELKFLAQAEKSYRQQPGTSEDSGATILAARLEEVSTVLGQELTQTLVRVENPKLRILAMAEYQELRQTFAKARREQEGFALPDFESEIISLQESQLAAKEKLLGVEKEIARMAAGPERMLLRVQVIEGFLELGLNDEVEKKLQAWARVAKTQDVSPELMQEWIGISAALMQQEINASSYNQPSGSVAGLNVAFAIWHKLPSQAQLAFAKTLNDISVEIGRHHLDRQGDLFLNRQSMAGRLLLISSSPKLTWSAAEKAQLGLEAGRANGKLDIFLQVYENHWNDLNGAERLQLRQAHGAALLELKERFKNDDTKLEALEEQAYVLAESWRLTVTEGQLIPDVETLAVEDVSMLELENLTELVKFCHGFGTGITEQGGRVSLDSLGNHQEVDQSQAPLHLLERKLANYRQADRAAAKAITDPGQRTLALAKLNIEQNQLGGIIGSQLVEVWPYATVELLSKVSNVDLSSVTTSDLEKLLQDTQWLKAQLGLVSLYDRAKSLLRMELQSLATEEKRLSRLFQEKDPVMRELLGQAESTPQERARRLQAIPYQVNNVAWALNSVSLWAEQGAENVAEYSTGDLQTVARAMAHYEGGRYDDAVILFQSLMERDSLDHPDAQSIVDSLGKSLLSLNQGRLDRQINLLKAFARAEDYPSAEAYQNAAKTGRRGRNERQVNRGLAELGIYLRSLPQEQAPTNLTVAIHGYLELHPESEAVKKLSDFIYQGPSSQSKHHREISSLLGAMDNLDSAADAEQALGELQILLDKDVDYWEGEGEMMMALYQASSQIQAHMPLGSEASRKVRYFESRIQTEEMSGQFYRELFSKENAAMLALTFVGAGLAAKAGQWASRAMRARLATQTAIGGVMTSAELEAVAAELVQLGRVSTVAEGELFLASRGLLAEVTTLDMAGMGISQGLKIAVLPEAANVGANAATFWAFNHLTQPGAESHNLGATAIDVGMIHFAMKPFHSWGHLEGLAMRILGGASAMTAAGVLRTEIHEILPGLHLAHEGEDPLSVYSFLHNVAFGAGMEAGGAAMGRGSMTLGKARIVETPARQNDINKLRQELGKIGLKIERDAQGNLNRDGEIFLLLASAHLKNPTFSFGRFSQLMKGGRFGQADAYLQKNGMAIKVSPQGKFLDRAPLEAEALTQDAVSAELIRIKKEIPRQILDLINDELAKVGLNFIDFQGKLNANANLFLELFRHHRNPASEFSFGTFISTLHNNGGHAASKYLSRTQVPYWISPDGILRPKTRTRPRSALRAQADELARVLDDISDIPEIDWTDLDATEIHSKSVDHHKGQDTAVLQHDTREPLDNQDTLRYRRATNATIENQVTTEFRSETSQVLDDLHQLFQQRLSGQVEAANDGQYHDVKNSHDRPTEKEPPQRVPTERLLPIDRKVASESAGLANSDAPTFRETKPENSSWLRVAGERREIDIASSAALKPLSSIEASFLLRLASDGMKPVHALVGRWMSAEESIIPGTRHGSVKINEKIVEDSNGHPKIEVEIAVKGARRAENLRNDLEGKVPGLRHLASEEGSEVFRLTHKSGLDLAEIIITTTELPFDHELATGIYQGFRKHFLPTLNAWFRGNGLRANFAARTHAILDRFDHLWEKTELSLLEQDAMMNLVEYLKEVPAIIRYTDVMDRLHQAEQVALHVGPEAYRGLQEQSDLASKLFVEVQQRLTTDELATGKVLAENQEIYGQYTDALQRLEHEIKALTELPGARQGIYFSNGSQKAALLEFTREEATILKAMGVDSAENLASHKGDGAKRYILAYGLGHLLQLSQTRRDPRIEWGIMRLTGALRQQLARGNQTQDTLNALLSMARRDALGMPLEPAFKAAGPQDFTLTGSQRNLLATRFLGGEIPFGVEPSNVLKILSVLQELASTGNRGSGQRAFRLVSVGQRLLQRIGEGYGPLMQQTHPNLYKYYISLKNKNGLNLEHAGSPWAAFSGVWARLSHVFSRGSSVPAVPQEFLQHQLGRDLQSLGKKRPEISGEIENLSRQLDEQFELGAVVENKRGQYFLMEPGGSVQGKPVGLEIHQAFAEWQQRRGFAAVNVEQAQWALRQIQSRLDSLGVKLEIAPTDSNMGVNLNHFSDQQRGALLYLNELLQQLPNQFFLTPRIQKIILPSPESGVNSRTKYDAATGSVFISIGTVQGSRRNFAASVLHELGHSISERYTRPDPEISPEVQQQIEQDHRIITGSGSHLGLEVLGNSQARKNYQRSLHEFLAEFNLMYVAAGPKLRQHIAALPQGSMERLAWERIYGELKTRIYCGKEYGGARTEFAERASIAWDHSESPREGGFQSQGPAQNYGSFAAWTDASQYYKAKGNGKPVNEDAVAQFRNGAIVADGMGGYGGGDKASAIVIDRVMRDMENDGDLVEAFKRAAEDVHQFNDGVGKAGAVAVAMRVHPQEGSVDLLEVVHAGDAKLRVFVPDGQGEYRSSERTVDHGLAEELYRGGKRNTLQMRIDQMANVVTSALGGSIHNPTIDHQMMQLPQGAKVVMGSDGLWDSVSTQEVADVLSRHASPEAAVAELKQILDGKMERLHRAKNLLATGEGRSLRVQTWDDYSQKFQHKNVTVVEISDKPGLFISKQGDVYNAQGQVVDHYKIDNLAIYIYHHDIP